MTRLVLILGDQLSLNISSLAAATKSQDRVVMGELSNEAKYVRHHKKKIAFVFAAMRHFAEELRQQEWKVEYRKLDDKPAICSFTDLVEQTLKTFKPREILVTEPGEWRVREQIDQWKEKFDIPVKILDDDRFICSHDEFNAWAEGKESLRMEYFYREMRRKTNLLMDGDEPAGGKWNYDTDNRKPASENLSPPVVQTCSPDEITQDVLEIVEARYSEHFGDLHPFWFAVTRKDAQKARDKFFQEALPKFGDYQDAMLIGEKYLFHSVLSAYVNVGLLDPLDLCRRAEQAYKEGTVPLNAAEGFIRQILGWREFVRGIYWQQGPNYTSQNSLGANRKLPQFYWSGETDMACIRAVVHQTREQAYAHHIQRLMVTGTFALIAGIDPRAVHEWCLAVYADAFEWVEAPNVIGMSQFADGGLVASKPYAASGAYINRMSNYCGECTYNVKKKTEESACPFNSLYWDFIARNEQELASNQRLGLTFGNWRRMSDDKQNALRKRASDLLANLDAGDRI